ncbi:MAG: hypothetical protein DMF74_13435 [Acidobacteria bacterium]|nr:MAG: hypothetical protein DMF74_13435 [Acidobacteriota bacterium]
MTNQKCDHDLSPNPLDELEEESGEGHAHLQNIATLDPAALRDTNKLAILNVQTTVRLALNQSGRDGNAYLIGQQRVQSMLQTLAKSRTIPVEIHGNFATQLPVNIRNLLDPV